MSITLSDSARQALQELSQKNPGHLRISVRTKGCAGMVYEFGYTEKINSSDEKVEVGDFFLYLDADRIMYLIGTHIDHVDDVEGRRFVFSNNAFNTCGCGHSFRLGE